MNAVIEASGLGKRYARRWALRDCTLTIPAGRVVGLVGPNGAGKTTLLHLAVGLLTPTEGTLSVLGMPPASSTGQLARVGFVAQDTPVYERLSVADHLRLGAWLNPGWDGALARRRVERLGLDPLARREFLQGLMEVVAEHGVSVVISSHLIADLERVCDYLVVLTDSRVQIAGDVSELLASHYRVSGRRRDPSRLPANQEVITQSHTDKQSALLVRTDDPVYDPAWAVTPVTVEDLVLAYMSRAREARPARPSSLEVAS